MSRLLGWLFICALYFEFWEGHDSRLNRRETYELQNDEWIHRFFASIKYLRNMLISIKSKNNYESYSYFSKCTCSQVIKFNVFLSQFVFNKASSYQ